VISLKAISLIGIDVTVPWSVCLSVCHGHALCSNGRRYRQDFEHRRHSMALAMESLTTIALSNGTIADLLRPPLPPKWSSKCTLGPDSRRVLPPGE